MMKADQATGEVFYKAFKALDSSAREAFMEKVVSDSRLREELIDIALIEQARQVKGRPISAREYFAKRRKRRSSS